MSKIVDLRGTHGSGKSYTVNLLRKKYGSEPIVEKGKVIGHYLPKLECAVVGRYTDTGGGCDGVGSPVEVVRRVQLFARRGYARIILEGILVSHTMQRYSTLAKQLEKQGHSYTFMFLNTPLETAISRVRFRREQKGNTKEFNPRNVIKDYHNVWEKVRLKMVAAGNTVKILNHKQPVKGIVRELTT